MIIHDIKNKTLKAIEAGEIFPVNKDYFKEFADFLNDEFGTDFKVKNDLFQNNRKQYYHSIFTEIHHSHKGVYGTHCWYEFSSEKHMNFVVEFNAFGGVDFTPVLSIIKGSFLDALDNKNANLVDVKIFTKEDIYLPDDYPYFRPLSEILTEDIAELLISNNFTNEYSSLHYLNALFYTGKLNGCQKRACEIYSATKLNGKDHVKEIAKEFSR